MPMLLQSLFEETKNHNIPKKDQKKMSRSCKYIENYQLLPELTCPAPTSNIHKKDMEDLLKYYHNPNIIVLIIESMCIGIVMPSHIAYKFKYIS